MEPTAVWEVISRRKRVVISALIIVTLGAVVASFLATPSYEAASKVLIMKPKQTGFGLQGMELLTALTTVFAVSPNVDVNRVLAISRPYIDKMIFKLQLRDEEGNLMSADTLVDPGMLSGAPKISIHQYQETDVLQIQATSPDPEETKMMANTLAQIMVDENQIYMRAEYASARVFLEGQMGNVKERYREALRNLTDFKKREKTIDLGIETKVGIDKMADLMRQKEDNIIDLAEARAKLSSLKEQLAKQGSDFLPASTLKESSQIEVLKRRLSQLELEFTEASSELTEQHPEVLSLKEQIKKVREDLKNEIEVYRSSAPGLIELESEIAALEAHFKGVNADINKYFDALWSLPDKVLRQADINMELKVTQEAYSFLLNSLYQIGIAESTTLSEIRVVEAAVRALNPVSPKRTANATLGVLVGLVIGIGLAFILEYMDKTVRTAEDMREFKPIPVIGAIPNQKKMRLIWTMDANDPLYEAYRKIQTHLNIMDHMAEKPLQNLLVTSAVPEEGKSTTVANLAISICHTGKKVAIIDGDLRRPSLHTYLGVPNDVGVADVLQGTVPIEDAIKPTRIQGLSVIPSGLPLPDPAKLIESDMMDQCISDLKARFDFLIMDSAPLLVKSDALLLAEHMDGTIVVVESGKTTYHAVNEVIEMLARANIEPLGFILNRFYIERGKYYYHQYYYGRYARKSFAAESNA